VTPKTEDQLDIQSIHRARERLVGQRTSLMNQIRGLLLERGLTAAQGRARLAYLLNALLADADEGVSLRMKAPLFDMRAEWRELDRRIKAFDSEFAAFSKSDGQARQLVSIPGIGPLTASALVAAVGDATSFARARDLAAWIGLVPRQTTTGGKPRLGGITHRGNKYLRKNLVHGARAALPSLARSQTNLGRWLTGLLARAHPNTVVVALANRLARIAWVVLTQNRRFQPDAPTRMS
jgi:transposase